jgi:hypothetical protein
MYPHGPDSRSAWGYNISSAATGRRAEKNHTESTASVQHSPTTARFCTAQPPVIPDDHSTAGAAVWSCPRRGDRRTFAANLAKRVLGDSEWSVSGTGLPDVHGARTGAKRVETGRVPPLFLDLPFSGEVGPSTRTGSDADS